MSEIRKYVGLDVGGTTMKAAVVDDTGRDFPHATMPTEPERGQEHGLETMCETIRRAVELAGTSKADIAGIGVATPGTMDLNTGMMLEPPNMKPWRNVPVRQHIAETFKLPTAFQNDANAAAFGEYWVGAGKDAKSLVFFTLGTGVGGGIIVFDRVLEGEHSHGGELGHMKIDMTNPRECGCGKFGCLEAYASATAVVKRAKEALANDCGKSKLHTWAVGDEGLTAEDVFNAAKAGDNLAGEIVDRTAFYLAMGAANAMHVINPEMVVFGGGMIEAGEQFLIDIRKYVKQLAFPVPAERTEIRYAQLGNKAGFIGAAACARRLVKGAHK
ncbi:MAG TPA: ROK family glucokinase [Gemmataceae bacterium]|nr:ROK family glucokinase [Gemmataceae bacterium]